ncbi:hypothetical protein [Arvimicrobium flavum]|uniref:hypothetical protein n=1 Tax=Arvimicrobium flavum TaxID=3393320 RepID=UPI00237AB974|nr:hypothetical protein [Mesorhizobium shangrilense]
MPKAKFASEEQKRAALYVEQMLREIGIICRTNAMSDVGHYVDMASLAAHEFLQKRGVKPDLRGRSK